MSIRFETTIDQLLAFNRYHYGNSPAWRKQRLLQGIIASALFVWFGWSMRQSRLGLLMEGNDLIFAVGILAGAVSSFFLVRARADRNVETAVRNLLAEGSNRTILGWCEVALVDNRLVVKRELMESRYDLRAIRKIVTTDDYTFVYLAAVSALTIPMRLFPEDQYSDFVDELRDVWENREPRPPSGRPDDRIQSMKPS